MTKFGGLVVALAMLLAPFTGNAEEPTGLTELYSKNGVLAVTLVAADTKVHIGDLELDGVTYNDVYAGPVLHIHPGETIRIHLVNHLKQPTNLHFHGMRGSPLGNGDNAHILIPPNGSFDYDLIVPATQPIGLYWYHAHPHGFAEHQIMGGLSGTIIVEGAKPSGLTERLFVLKDMVFDDDTGNPVIDDAMHSIVQSVNGRLTTAEAMQPGQTQLWRVTNQSANRRLHLALRFHRFRIISRDGEPYSGTEPLDELDLAPGNRFDVLVDAGPAGHYALQVMGLMTGPGADRVPDRTIGYLDVAGESVRQAASVSATTEPLDLRSVVVAEKREITFSQTNADKNGHQDFFLNGQKYLESRIDVRAKLGDTEEWIIRNDSDDFHAFHIHQIGFQLIEVNGKSVPFNGYVDTVLIPIRGQVKLRLPFTDPLIVGRFMFHCHVLKHEDSGMMANIEIYDPTPPTVMVRLNRLYLHVVWWWNGVPWKQCGLGDA